MPFVIEYDADTDDVQDLAPYVEALRNLDTEFAEGTISHKVLVDRAVILLGPDVNSVWPHCKAVYALLDSKLGGRRVIAIRHSYVFQSLVFDRSLTQADRTVKPFTRDDSYFVMYKFPSLVHAIIWMIARGNSNLMEWNHLRWLGVKGPGKKGAARSTTRSPSPDEILDASDGDSVMEVDVHDNRE